MDADQIVRDPSIFDIDIKKSGYYVAPVTGWTNEWVLKVQDEKIVSCERNGGSEGWRLISASFWTPEDGMKLKQQIEYWFEKEEYRRYYWDDIPLFLASDSFELGICEIAEDAVIEIDSIDELCEIDPIWGKRYENR